MTGFLAKPIKEEELPPVETAIDRDLEVQTFKDFPPVDSYLDFGSCNWLGSNNSDFDFFEKEMEIGQDGVTVSEETRLEGQDMSDSIEITSKLCGEVSSNTSALMIDLTPVLYGSSMLEDIGASSVITEVKPELCDDMSENFEGVAEPAWRETELVISKDSRAMEDGTGDVACLTMNLDDDELKKTDVGLASSDEVGLEKVSLNIGDDEDKGETSSAESESEASSSSSSLSASSSSEEEESDEEDCQEDENNKEKKFDDQMVMGKEDDMAGELEEGEIQVEEDDDEVDEMVAWSYDEDEDLGWQTNEPISSKNELKEIPPVPPVDVTLKPHHVTLPVGVVLSVLTTPLTQVIVEGMENHIPLSEGSILWITERRTPLGLVDEVFAQVECPYYSVRFNSENEVPEGVSEGTPVSFVAEYAQHIPNIKELKKKGYDASGDNDEEIEDEFEFSDDEKEAEYRKTQKVEKRGMIDDQQNGNARNKKKKNRRNKKKKKKKNRDLERPTSNDSGEWTENRGSSSLSSNRCDPQMGGPVSNHQPRPQINGFPPNSGGWRPQSNQQNSYQLPPVPNQMVMPNLPPMQIPLMAMLNQMMFRPQFNDGQLSIHGGPGGLNFFQPQATAPWPSLVGQNCFNQQRMGHGIQPPQLLNELILNLLASQGLQMHRPQSPMNPQFQMQPQFPMNSLFQTLNNNRPQSPVNPHFQMQLQFPVNPQFQMLKNNRPQSPVNPQCQMQPQRPRSQFTQSPTNQQSPVQPQSQVFSTTQSSKRGSRGRGRGRFGCGRGSGRQQSG